jgi:hypothetical protein
LAAATVIEEQLAKLMAMNATMKVRVRLQISTAFTIIFKRRHMASSDMNAEGQRLGQKFAVNSRCSNRAGKEALCV